MKKILYIDAHSQKGHINFNRIYLSALQKTSCDIHIVFKKGYLDLCEEFSNAKSELVLPDWLYPKSSGKLSSRFFLLLQLLYIKRNIDFSQYDYVFLSSYEEISLFFAGIKTKMYLINHDNARGFDSKIKTFFLKHISKYHTHIVFMDYIKQRFIENGIEDVMVIPHGLLRPYVVPDTDQFAILKQLDSRLVSKEYNYILFSPSILSDEQQLISILSNQTFNDYLKAKHILFVVRNKISNLAANNILFISDYLTNYQYQSLFMASTAIVICYPESFKYRVSGVLFECFANNKLCFVSELPALKAFKPYFMYNPYFINTQDLIIRMDEILGFDLYTKKLFTKTATLHPNFVDFCK